MRWLLAIPFLLVLLVLAVTIVRGRGRRADRARRRDRDMPRCTCGYLLAGLEIPRCPECGRAIGFDCTFQELGISEEELRAHAEQRRQARGDQAPPAPSAGS